jgi:predicted RNA binding protein YcfA (HicA-like mRNA interferase family)
VSAGRAETMKLVRRLEKQGFVVERTGGGHWKVTHPEREGHVTMGFSPSSSGTKKSMKRLRELGFKP